MVRRDFSPRNGIVKPTDQRGATQFWVWERICPDRRPDPRPEYRSGLGNERANASRRASVWVRAVTVWAPLWGVDQRTVTGWPLNGIVMTRSMPRLVNSLRIALWLGYQRLSSLSRQSSLSLGHQPAAYKPSSANPRSCIVSPNARIENPIPRDYHLAAVAACPDWQIAWQ